jgi:hypothetical protein
MKWVIYISKRPGHRSVVAIPVVEVPGTSRSDGRHVTVLAAKHFKVSQNRVLALPQPQSEDYIPASVTLV